MKKSRVAFFSLFQLRGNKNTLQNKMMAKIVDFISLKTIFEFCLFRLHYYTMCHEVLENEKWQGAHWLSQYWTSPSCHPRRFGLRSRGQGAQLGLRVEMERLQPKSGRQDGAKLRFLSVQK